MFFKRKKKIDKLLQEVNNMSDEELLEHEKELYLKAGIRIAGGIGGLIAGIVIFSFMVPYL